MAEADRLIDFETDGCVGILTLNRPDARNAISRDVALAIEAMVDAIEADPEIRVVVLRANMDGQRNPIFCAGADLKALTTGVPVTDRGGFAGFVYRQRSKPFVAAIDGMALAGGAEIALACDIIVASTRASFAMPEVKRNLFAGAGAMFRLPAAVGKATAMDMLLTAEPISAERAYALGLVSRLVEPGQADAMAMHVARAIAENAPLAVQASRRCVEAWEQLSYADQRELGRQAAHSLMDTEDMQEGLRAFVEKRPPAWKGR